METWLPLIIQLVAGVIGGNAAGAALKEKSLGGAGNSIVGLIGGAILGQIVQRMGGGDAAAGMDIGRIIGDLVSGGAGGAILTAVVGVLKTQFAANR